MIIVSMTSTSYRFNLVRYTLLSLLNQLVKPDKIILNISKQPYLKDEGILAVPYWFKYYENNGVEINWVENTGPYRKLLPTFLLSNDSDIIVTCDDDVIYGESWLGSLIKEHEKYPDSIVCGRARKPVKNFLGNLRSYSLWPVVNSDKNGMDLIPIGISGVLYKKSLMDLDFLYDNRFLLEAPKQDDLWYKISSARKKTNVRVATNTYKYVFPVETYITLYQENSSVSYKWKWDNFFIASLERIISKIKAYFGFENSANDLVWREIIRKYL